ncbi:MAG: tripartite tricarboxylate transporter TctB family protein, partial [Deltaproteobacteria bacterium]|nr:tripartite tricarboxylate transporter TctB family protein [Deltaproteobacteria bacterium]
GGSVVMPADPLSSRKNVVDVVFTIVTIIFFTVILVMSFFLSHTAGSVPRLISIIGICLSIFSLIAKPKKDAETPHGENSDSGASKGVPFLSSLGIMIAYFIGMIVLGFTLSTFVMMVFMPVLLGYRNYKVNILTAIVVTAVLYVSFVYFFYVRLPVGIIFELFR